MNDLLQRDFSKIVSGSILAGADFLLILGSSEPVTPVTLTFFMRRKFFRETRSTSNPR